jgi:tetratricopeptide (TPR) repeat protein
MSEKFDLKPISRGAVPRAIQKVERYRLLNEPSAAESICRDILAIDPDNQQVIVMLVLSLTDQFATSHGRVMHEVRDALSRITDPYQRAYYTGLTSERHGQELLRRVSMGSSTMAYGAFREAMEWYEKAEAIRPHDDDDSILRWNTCARVLAREGHLKPPVVTEYEPVLEE